MIYDAPLDTHYRFRATAVHLSVPSSQDKNEFDCWFMEAMNHHFHVQNLLKCRVSSISIIHQGL
jgi:hypothetical protein